MAGFTSGSYLWELDGNPGGTPSWLPLGTVMDIPEDNVAFTGEEIRGDATGDLVLGVINRAGSMSISFTLLEANLQAAKILQWPLSPTTLGEIDLSTVGCPIVGRQLRITAHGCARPYQRLFHNVGVAPGFNITQRWGSRNRNVPLVLQVYATFFEGVDPNPDRWALFDQVDNPPT